MRTVTRVRFRSWLTAMALVVVIVVACLGFLAPNVTSQATEDRQAARAFGTGIWATLAQDEALYCLVNGTTSWQNTSGNLTMNETVANPAAQGCYGPNQGMIFVTRNAATRAVQSLLLVDEVDANHTGNFDYVYVYYIPIQGTSINSTQEIEIAPGGVYSCTGGRCGGAPATLPSCSATSTWSLGPKGWGISLNQCATAGVIAGLGTASLVAAIIGACSGPAAAVGFVVSVALAATATSLSFWDAAGGNIGIWWGGTYFKICFWGWCYNVYLPFVWLWYNPVWPGF